MKRDAPLDDESGHSELLINNKYDVSVSLVPVNEKVFVNNLRKASGS